MKKKEHTDYEVRSLDAMCVNESELDYKWYQKIKYLVLGMLFGFVFIKAEVVSWYRVQEMFRFQSFHMYGIIGSAVVVAAISIWIIKKFNIKTIQGEQIYIPNKKFNNGQIIGGLLFGFGWAITGACPGPMFALIGYGFLPMLIVLFFAILGTFIYGLLREKLP